MMTSGFTIFLRTKDTFASLKGQLQEELVLRINKLFFLSGLVTGITVILEEQKRFGLGPSVLILLLSGVLGLIIGKYVVSYLYFRIGNQLKGQASLQQVRLVLAYAMIPRFLELPVFLYLVMSGMHGKMAGLDFWIVNLVYAFLWFLSLKISVVGLMKFNDFGLKKALINNTPGLLIGLLFYLFLLV